MTIERALWRAHLPSFDPISIIRKEQRDTSNALRWLGLDHLPMRECSDIYPCRGGLCPRCIRQLRINLLDFLYDERLHRLSWHFVTIRVAGWTIPPGDDRPFGQLRDQSCIYALMTKFRRMKIDGLLIFGSIETVYVTVDNVPTGKPFHLHLMVSGASEVEITKAVNASISLDFSVPRPLRVDPVFPTDKDFFRCASYAFKQPLAKKSKASMDDDGIRQLLKPAERREIILNYGVHGWQDRLILLGIRCDNGPFRLIADLSTTARSAISTRLRKLPSRQSRRPPTGQG